ncbi:MAG TPA: hypothetical protein VJ836_04970 [Candidatus Saccharimonadales bacterium]|nr:hypothetical protein [Candidatus Saccharimonadales bacterium]
MNIFDTINELNLPKDAYVVVGGGILVALGLLEWDEDVDICVAPEIFARFQAKGWRQEEWAGKPVLKHAAYDIGVGFGEWTLKDLQADAMIVNDIPFMSLQKLLQWKREMGRPKDLRHIELIEQYLQDHKPAPAR